MTDGDGLTYIVLLRSGGFFVFFFATAVYAKQVCIQKKKNKTSTTEGEGEQASAGLFVCQESFT